MAIRKKTTTTKKVVKKTTKKAAVKRKSAAPKVEVRPYKHLGDQVNAFLAEHTDGVYFHADAATRAETESALRSVDESRPVIITSEKIFTAAELRGMGFEVFQNGEGGKLVGIRK